MNASLTLPKNPPIQDMGRGAIARAALIAAAVQVFGESSLESSTTREIALRAGQNVASISYYFTSKEGLYLAVIEHINQIILAKTGPLLDEVSEFLSGPQPDPDLCIDYFGRLLSASLATNSEMLAVTALIVREQMHPSAGFSIMYEGSLARLQKLGARLIDAYAGPAPDSQDSTVRFHAMLGQSLAFRLARETIIRGARWKTIGKRQEEMIRRVVIEQATDILRGLKARRQSSA